MLGISYIRSIVHNNYCIVDLVEYRSSSNIELTFGMYNARIKVEHFHTEPEHYSYTIFIEQLFFRPGWLSTDTQ